MSDDPVQSIIAMLENIEGGIAGLTAEVHAARSASIHPQIKNKDINAIHRAAHDGAALAASKSLQELNKKILILQAIATEGVKIVESARSNFKSLSRWKIAVAGLILLLSLMGMFLAGIYVTRSGSILSTEIGCEYFGARWSEKQDGSGFVCWR